MSEVVPQGGWVYDIGKVSLIAQSKNQLIEVLRQYRKSNRIPEGDLKKDVEDHIKQKNSGYEFPSFKMEVKK